MKKIIGILAMMLLIIATVIPISGSKNINKENILDENNDSIRQNAKDSVTNKNLLLDGLFNFRILNRDWNYWSNKPNIFSMNTGNIGIGTDSPIEKLDVRGTVSIDGFKMSTNAVNGYVLTSDGSGIGTWKNNPGGGNIDGSGTVDYITKFTDSTKIDDSLICEKNGKIGIGTTQPHNILHLHKNDIADSYVQLSNLNSVIGGLVVGIDPFANSFIWNFENSEIFIGTNNDYAMTLDPDGSVGIGTTDPNEKLHVSGGHIMTDSSYGYKLRHDNGYTSEIESHTDQLWISNSAGGEIDFLTGETPGNVNSKMTIFPSGVIHLWGNVGLKTYFPAYELDVNGDVQAHAYHTGDIYFQKDGEELWRMFEDENGLYLENLLDRKVYRFVLEDLDETETLNQRIEDLESRITELESILN